MYKRQGQNSSRFLTSAAYLSLENINFGYTIPSKICKKAFLQSVRVCLAADNVWIWSKRQGLDPRQFMNGGSSAQGASYYSAVRTISGGLTVTF